jgi:polyisoprenoid-binding protein YceI
VNVPVGNLQELYRMNYLHMKNPLLALCLLAFSGSLFAQSLTVDPAKSSVQWEGGKLVGGSHSGLIQIKSGTLEVGNNTLNSASFVIDMTSMTNTDLDETYGQKLVGHLMSDDFFGVEKFPEASLSIMSASQFVDGKSQVLASVTIKGHKEQIEFEVVRKGNVFEAEIVLDRAKFDVRYGSGSFFDDLGDDLILDAFTMNIRLETI